MNKKKISLIIVIVLFISILIAITTIYNKNINNQKQLEEEAVSTGIIKTDDKNFNKEVLESDKIVVLDFYENMCPPCTSMIPTLVKIAKMKETVKVVMINADSNDTKELTKKYEINATPTIIILQKDKEIKRFIGATKEEDIINIINKAKEKKDEK